MNPQALHHGTDAVVYVVHCIDTEGPLYESVEATFARLREIFNLDLPASRETLTRLQRGELPLGGFESAVARVVDPHLLAYNDTWDKIDDMLDRIMSDEFRHALPDSDGRGWIYNWHCVDHVGYGVNPRRKDCGYHNIFDHYSLVLQASNAPDGLHWHYHPTHPSGCSHRDATFYFHDTKFFQILARRIIDRGWFPSVSRPGFFTERPESHWLLEQWIPFDFANHGSDDDGGGQGDVGSGRLGDWRRAPREWVVYQPAHDDYQVPGACRRYIARCLNVGTRWQGLLTEEEVRKAFRRAQQEGPTIMAFADHDFRDIGRDVQFVQHLLKKVSAEFPSVRFRYCEAREAMNRVLFGTFQPPTKPLLTARWDRNLQGSPVLCVDCAEPAFGPQPFLAIKTKAGEYHHDNFDFQETFRRWTYTFDGVSFEPDTIARIGVAVNDRRGFAHVVDASPVPPRGSD